MKNKKENELIGHIVMVHPFLTTDPIQRQGEIGKVIDVSAINKEVLTIEFNDGQKAAYMSDGLLTLYPVPVILQSLASNQHILSAADQKNIMKIYQLATEKKYSDALQLALENKSAQFFCTTSCRDWLGMKEGQKKNRNKGQKP